MHIRSVVALCAVLTAASTPAWAQFAKPEDAIKYRQSAFTVMANHFGRINAMAQGKAPFNAAVVQKNAALVDTLIQLPFGSFGPGTDKGAPTKASEKIWKEEAKFKAAAEANQKAVAKLAADAKSGDEAKFKAAFGEVGKTCKACHDDYQLKEARN